ncbi:uncharacterized protein F5147DRAFT_837448 [Suillus discolor]|uniref:Uncharacterized protein n=1 Tax=Suillus discolor TaxID=1912936 RepID=A0A9P7F4L4_9AGAM|nr:uncharacterized protein F5147DRAFT_837448 [Suillus discolor]KAG2107186.1 hypothetical protein F5147DRAFT_837448 [Suillus discolor]
MKSAEKRNSDNTAPAVAGPSDDAPLVLFDMNSHGQIPLIDKENPFYCPSFPAAAYLATLRQARKSNPFLFQDISLRSFFWKIGLCFTKENQNYTSNSIPRNSLDAPLWSSSPAVQSPIILARNQVSDDSPVLRRGSTGLAWRRASMRVPKRPRDSSEPEDPIFFGGPSKRGRSSQSIHTSPVDNSGIEPLSYTLHHHDPLAETSTFAPAPTWVYESETGDETPVDLSYLMNRLEMVIPGTGVHQTFLGDPLAVLHLTHQKITNVLADRGLLTEIVLTLLRGGNIDRLVLGPTMCEEDGLNLHSGNLLRVFSKPGYYLTLKELVLDGAHLERDFDLVHIQQLPNLERLHLEGTDIGNEAVFLLVTLKEKLYYLNLAHNPKIDDDAIPAILLLTNLGYLSIQATGVEMPGFRRLAAVIHAEDRVIDIEIPFRCEKYIDNLHKQYLVDPALPLVTDPSACPLLSDVALIRNLQAHADVNPSIVPTGTRLEMIERLKKLLERRQMDLVRVTQGYRDAAAYTAMELEIRRKYTFSVD